jgi:hypothetical protein
LPGGNPIDAEARELARRLATLEEGAIRARAAGRALAALEPGRAAETIAALMAQGAAGDAPAAIAAVGQALLDPLGGLGYDRLADLYAAAAGLGLGQVTALLLSPPPRRAWEEPFDKPDARLAHLTLGHKKSLARVHRDPDLLARLAAEGEPAVVRELLRNPQLTEPFAVRIAARRPCRPGTLRCLHEERRWRTRPAVLLALVRNPYLETELALKILPSVAAVELLEIEKDGSLHPLVRAMASRLREGRDGGAPAGGADG